MAIVARGGHYGEVAVGGGLTVFVSFKTANISESGTLQHNIRKPSLRTYCAGLGSLY